MMIISLDYYLNKMRQTAKQIITLEFHQRTEPCTP